LQVVCDMKFGFDKKVSLLDREYLLAD
jgi:hypothetical protein